MALIYESLWKFIQLIFVPEVLWAIFPLAIATILIMAYFERYKNERPGWNTYFTNTLVLLFVSMNLLRYIYYINGQGIQNFQIYPYKSITSVAVLIIGLLLLRINFDHLFPEKIAKYISSPLTINLIALGLILLVYSPENITLVNFIAVMIIILILSGILNLMRIPTKRIFKYVEKQKEKERLEDIKKEKKDIVRLKKELGERNKELQNIKLREADKQKKEAIKIKKAIKR